jgi:hypothetical protein
VTLKLKEREEEDEEKIFFNKKKYVYTRIERRKKSRW